MGALNEKLYCDAVLWVEIIEVHQIVLKSGVICLPTLSAYGHLERIRLTESFESQSQPVLCLQVCSGDCLSAGIPDVNNEATQIGDRLIVEGDAERHRIISGGPDDPPPFNTVGKSLLG